MNKQTLQVEWLMAESEAEWERLCVEPPSVSNQAQQQRHFAQNASELTISVRSRPSLVEMVIGDQTLIPAVYEISSGEFEAGWQGYLATQYGVSPTHFTP